LAVRGIGQTGLIGWMSGDKVPDAAILVLGRLAAPDAIADLQQLADSTQHNGFRKRIVAALAVAAEASGLTPSQLVERTVPAGGLDQTGTSVLTASPVTARARVDDQLKVAIQWQQATGDWTAKPPADALTADVNRVRRRSRNCATCLARSDAGSNACSRPTAAGRPGSGAATTSTTRSPAGR
jgi:hypothetical protein